MEQSERTSWAICLFCVGLIVALTRHDSQSGWPVAPRILGCVAIVVGFGAVRRRSVGYDESHFHGKPADLQFLVTLIAGVVAVASLGRETGTVRQSDVDRMLGWVLLALAVLATVVFLAGVLTVVVAHFSERGPKDT